MSRHEASELISHLEEDRIFLGEKSKVSELIVAAVEGADQTERNLFVPGRRIRYRRIGAPVAGRIIAKENVGQNSIAQISGADSEREIGCDRFYLLRAEEWVYALLMQISIWLLSRSVKQKARSNGESFECSRISPQATLACLIRSMSA